MGSKGPLSILKNCFNGNLRRLRIPRRMLCILMMNSSSSTATYRKICCSISTGSIWRSDVVLIMRPRVLASMPFACLSEITKPIYQIDLGRTLPSMNKNSRDQHAELQSLVAQGRVSKEGGESNPTYVPPSLAVFHADRERFFVS